MTEELWKDNVKLMKNAPAVSTSFRTVKQNEARELFVMLELKLPKTFGVCLMDTMQDTWRLLGHSINFAS